MFFFDPLEQFSIEIYSSYFFNEVQINSVVNLKTIFYFNFILILFFIYSHKQIIIQNKCQKLIIFFFFFFLGILKNSF